ncbi:MAG: hypothetical protein K940chlam3_01731 [Chlamydiae bacterium]|nr:hypothetical protein [Chlamydiota bacterium]
MKADAGLIIFVRHLPGGSEFLDEVGQEGKITEIAARVREADWSRFSTITELDLSQKQIKILPPEIGKLTRLESLDLSKNELRELPSEIGLLTNLIELGLHVNILTKLPPEIKNLKNLNAVDAAYNEFDTLPIELGDEIELIQKYNNYVLHHLDKSSKFFKLNNLERDSELRYYVRTSLNKSSPTRHIFVKKLMTDRFLFRFVRFLPGGNEFLKEIGGDQVPEVVQRIRDADWSRFTILTELDLNGKKLVKLPPEIGRLTRLETLSLANTNLKELPPEIGLLTNLCVLNLQKNQLKKLPAEIKNLKHLNAISIYENEFDSLPSVLGDENVIVQKHINYVHCFPSYPNHPEFLKASKLSQYNWIRGILVTSLIKTSPARHLMEKQLLTDRNLIFFVKLLPGGSKFLQEIGGDQIPELARRVRDADWGRFSSVKELILVNRKFSELPLEVGKLTGLELLDLAGNKLTTLPSEVGQLTNLRILGLRNNQLESLPPEIRNLKHLHAVDISENEFDSLPEEFGNERELLRKHRNYFGEGSESIIKNSPEYRMLTALKDSKNYFKSFVEKYESVLNTSCDRNIKKPVSKEESKKTESQKGDGQSPKKRKKRRRRKKSLPSPIDKTPQEPLREPKIRRPVVRRKKKSLKGALKRVRKNPNVVAATLTARSVIKNKKKSSIPKKFLRALETMSTMRPKNVKCIRFIRLAVDLGGSLRRTSGDHHIMTFPNGRHISIPRHNPVSRGTASAIMDRLREEGESQLSQFQS